MSKTKFELTADLIKVEKEPILGAFTKDAFDDVRQQNSFLSPVQNTPEPATPNIVEEVPLKIERQSISLYISKNLKRRFHLNCIQNGMSMTDAMEEALELYLKSKTV